MTTPNNKEEKCPRHTVCDDKNCYARKYHDMLPCTCNVSPTPDSMYGQIVHCDKCLGVIEKLSTGIPEGWNICNCSPTPTDSWENRFDRLFTNEIEYDLITREYIKIKSFISQVRQKAARETLQFIAMKEGWEETEEHYAKLLGIDLSDIK